MGARFFADVSAEKNPAGSISVFFAILLPLVCSLFFSMLEVTRIRGLDVNSRQMALQMLENTFSEYQPLLWQQYGILALDMGYASGEGDIAKVAARMMEFGTWYDQAVGGDGQERFLALSPGGCEITAYELLTDHGAVALIRQGAGLPGKTRRWRLFGSGSVRPMIPQRARAVIWISENWWIRGRRRWIR